MKFQKSLKAAILFSLAPAVFSAIDAYSHPIHTNSTGQITIAEKQLDADFDKIIADTIKLTEIAAPPFKEETRAKAFAKMLTQSGLKNVKIDEVGNVIGLRKGKGSKNLIVVAAHIDTVFPPETNVKVKKIDNKLFAPGIGDDTVSLSIMLGIIRALDKAKIETESDILFVGDVGEEGPGNLRGMRHLFTKGEYAGKITKFISLEPGIGGDIVNKGIGSKRYKVTFHGPGGHSYGDFGIVNPAYALADAITNFSNYPGPMIDNTVFNVGILEGGTSVNSIPHTVAMTVDMRSASDTELKKIDNYFLAQLQPAADKENKLRDTKRGKITFEAKSIGERPSGVTPIDSSMFKAIEEIYSRYGFKVATSASSTDSNIPMSLGIPALTLGSGIGGDGAHSLNEYIELDKELNIKGILANLEIIVELANSH